MQIVYTAGPDGHKRGYFGGSTRRILLAYFAPNRSM